MKLTPHQVLQDRYTIIRPLGEGGTGTTYEAKDGDTGQTVAIKALSVRSLQDWKTLELFEREVRVLRDLDHPGIPAYLDAIREEDPNHGEVLLLVQERVQGHDLQRYLTQNRAITEDTARHWATQILHILIYLHERTPSTIHRDIKPGNLILRPDGKLVMVDFGAVRDAIRNENDMASTVVGTYGYMAPEQLRSQADPSTDLYGLGATLVALLTATDPAKLPHERLRIVFDKHVTLTPGFSHWLQTLLSPVPEDRPPGARQALRDLEDLDHPNQPQRPPTKPQRNPLSKRKPLSKRIEDAKRQNAKYFEIQPPKGSDIIFEHNAQGMHVKLRKRNPRRLKEMFGASLLSLVLAGLWWLELLPTSTLQNGLLGSIALLWIFILLWSAEHTRQQIVSLGEDRLTLAYQFWGVTWRQRSIKRHKIQSIETYKGHFKTQQFTRILTHKDKHELGKDLPHQEQRWLTQLLSTWHAGGRLETTSTRPPRKRRNAKRNKQHTRKTLPPKQHSRKSKKHKQSRARHHKQRRK